MTQARFRMLSRLALAAAVVVGTAGALWALTSQQVADFLNEGPVRLLDLEGASRRVVIGGGSLLAVLLAGALALPQTPSIPRAAAGLAAMAVTVAFAPATALPAAALYVLALTASMLASLPPARLEAIAPRRRPGAWVTGSLVASVALAGASIVGFWLAAPLIDDGRIAQERLEFAFEAPRAPGTTGAVPQAASNASGRVLAEGSLAGADSFHFGSGNVRLLRSPEGQHLLRFADYEVRNGPDLFVYLSPDPDGDVKAAGALSLGMVKATRGAVNYELPAGVDATRFRSAVIWCKSFDVVFAVARLQ